MANPDPKLAELLRWSVEAGNPAKASESAPAPADSTDMSAGGRGAANASAPRLSGANAETLASLLGVGGPSDAELMKASVAAAQDPAAALADRETALDNLQQLLESLDNAADLAPLGLWTPLIALLRSEPPEVRRGAAWCVGTAVQNSRPSQERALAGGALPPLVRMATGEAEPDERVRKKARFAISSLVRNFQPGVDEVLKLSGDRGEKVDATDMDSVDKLMQRLGR